MAENFEISYKQEVLRKSIHMFSLLIPILYSFVSRETAIYILVPVTLISIIIDFASRKKSKFRKYFHKIFGKMLRPHEYYDVFTFNGATWVFISAAICVIVFPKIIMITGFSILIISDIGSALVGRRFGKHKLFVGKSWEGTITFWVTAFIVVLIIGFLSSAPNYYFYIGLIAAFIGGWAEAASTMLKMDDNLSIPISIGLVMWGGDYLINHYYQVSFINIL